MRALAAILLLLMSAGAALAQLAQPCPYVTVGWSQQYQSPITSILYDQQHQLLYVIWNSTNANAFVGVPYSVMQALSNGSMKNPVSYVTGYVIPSFHALLLAQTNNCPLLFEDGSYIWSD